MIAVAITMAWLWCQMGRFKYIRNDLGFSHKAVSRVYKEWYILHILHAQGL